MSDSTDWTADIEMLLDKIRQNCVILCEQHKKQYFHLQSWLKYFRLPCIVLSSINAVASIGLPAYIAQKHVSLINCLISLATTIITSTELYLQIEKSMSIELEASKEYYMLAVDIGKMLELQRDHRDIGATTFLDSCMSSYKKLFEYSGTLQKKLKDKLTIIDCDMMMSDLPGMEDMPCTGSNGLINTHTETAALKNMVLTSHDYFATNGINKQEQEQQQEQEQDHV